MTARTPRPGEVCRGLLAALDASEGRRKRRARDTSADAIGLAIKRTILDAAVADDPDPDAFEAWLLRRCLDAPSDVSVGAMRAMAREVLADWRLAAEAAPFASWLAAGAPSDDRDGDPSARNVSAV